MNVGASHKVTGSLVLLFEGDVELQVSVGVSNGAAVDPKRNRGTGCVPDLALATALAGTGVHFRSTRIMITMDWVAIR